MLLAHARFQMVLKKPFEYGKLANFLHQIILASVGKSQNPAIIHKAYIPKKNLREISFTQYFSNTFMRATEVNVYDFIG